MVQRTYYPPPEGQFADTSCGCSDRLHGYSLHDIERAVKTAVRARKWIAADRDQVHQAAWDGIVDLLCDGQDHPTYRDLLRAGDQGIDRMVAGDKHHYGWARNHGIGTAPRFNAYWMPWVARRGDTSGPQDRVVERVAVEEVRASLSPLNQRVLDALAACMGDLDAAAVVADLKSRKLRSQVLIARAAFLALWHEGETPRVQQRGVGVLRRKSKRVCGTAGGYTLHLERKQQPCDACRAANTAVAAARRARIAGAA